MKKYIIWGLLLTTLIPLLVMPPVFFPVDWGKTITFRMIMSLIIILALHQTFLKNADTGINKLKKNKIALILGIFTLLIFLSCLFSADIKFSLWGSPYRSGGAVTYLFYIIFSLACFVYLSKNDWKKMFDFSVTASFLVCFIALIQFYGLFNNIFISVPGRPPSTMGNPIVLGLYLVLMFFISLSLLLKEENEQKKIFYLSALVLIFFVLLITGSRSAYLGLILGLAFYGFYYLNKPGKKIFWIKIGTLFLAGMGLFLLIYANSQPKAPDFLQNNKIFSAVYQRLSIKEFIIDPRFSSWQVVAKAIKERPILGWGPENLSIGFDKHYDPSLPYISKEWGGWWDKAHNIILDTAASTGVPSAIAYLALLFFAIYEIQKFKNKHPDQASSTQALQAGFIAYFATNFFTFDSFSTYIVFFMLLGYCMHLAHEQNELAKPVFSKKRPAIFVLGLLFLSFFIWNYNIKPISINAKINKSDIYAENKNCSNALPEIESASKTKSYLDAYLRIHYIETIKKCAGSADKGIQLIDEALKIRPTYSRFWIFGAGFLNIQARQATDENAKKELLQKSNNYLKKAGELAPKHQEILSEFAKTYLIAGDYASMKTVAEKCIALDPNLSDCWWIKGIAETYLKETKLAAEDLKTAVLKTLGTPKKESLYMLIDACVKTEDYKCLVNNYNQLIALDPQNPQLYASLALANLKSKNYAEAKKQALKFLELMPEAKNEVEQFLKMLPVNYR